ncbi:hypothetical protein [Treponema sp. R6D11]
MKLLKLIVIQFFIIFTFGGCSKSDTILNGIWYIAIRSIDLETNNEENGMYNYLETLKIDGEYYSWEKIKIYDIGLFLEYGERGKIKILKNEIYIFIFYYTFILF